VRGFRRGRSWHSFQFAFGFFRCFFSLDFSSEFPLFSFFGSFCGFVPFPLGFSL
jgi:hypothetical protein